MPLETRPLTITDLAPTPTDQAELLTCLLCGIEEGEEGDIPAFLHTLGKIARERGMTDLAKGVGVTRERLYKSLDGQTEPRFQTVAAVLEHLGFALTVTLKADAASKAKSTAAE